MSNKAEATFHGRTPRAYLVGDWVYVTQLPEFDHRLGRIDEIRDKPFPYLVRFNNGDQYGAFDWLALTPVGPRGHVAYGLPTDRPEETTGEHVFHKLSDDLYQDWDAPLTYIPAKRGWTPTPGELLVSLGIIALIVGLFVFFVFFYRGW